MPIFAKEEATMKKYQATYSNLNNLILYAKNWGEAMSKARDYQARYGQLLDLRKSKDIAS